VRFEPIDGLTLGGLYTSSRRDVVTFDQVESMNVFDPSAAASPLTIRANDRVGVGVVPRTFTQNFKTWNWSAEYRALGQKLNYVGATNKQSIDSFAPSDLGNAYGTLAVFPDEYRGIGQVTNTHSNETFHEIRLSSDERIAGIFDYVVGYLYDKLDAPTNLTQPTPVLKSDFSADRLSITPIVRGSLATEKSFFANINVHIGDATELSGGIRRIKYRSQSETIIRGNPVGAPEDRLFKTTIYSASLKHNFSDRFMAYASFGTSWRPGSATNMIGLVNTQANPGRFDETLSSFVYPEPEKSESYEIGIKTDWLDKRLRVNLTAFHQKFKNYAFSSSGVMFAGYNVSTGDPTRFTVSSGMAVGVPAKVDGVEAEVSFQATPQWNMNLVAAYAKSKIEKGIIPCNDYNPNDGIADSAPSAPTFAQIIAANGGAQVATCEINTRAGKTAPFSMTFQTQYNQPLSGRMDGYVRGMVTYQGKSLNDPVNAVDDIDAYGIVNLFAGIRAHDGAWDIGLYGKNIFDVRRVTSRGSNALSASFSGASGSPVVSSYRSITINDPREIGVNFRLSFGSR
jgi:iron complex outermembrane receptor protein